MFNSSLPDVLSKNFVGVVILCQEVKTEDIWLSILLQYLLHVHFQVVQSWKNWLKYLERTICFEYLVKTVAQYKNKYFQKTWLE